MWRVLHQHFQSFVACRRGQFALAVALLSPVLLGAAGGGIDFYIYQHHCSELQSVADEAALTAAKEAALKGWSTESSKQSVAAVVEANLSNRFSGTASYTYDVQVDSAKHRIQVTLTQDHYGYFLLGYFTGSPQIAVQASARATGQAAVCLIARQATGRGALDMAGGSKVYASGCTTYSNSIDQHGLSVKDTSRLTTQLACTAGGYEGKGSNFFKLPITDCPSLDDPLATRAALVDSQIVSMSCDYTKKTDVKKAMKTLTPGVYCGDININDHSTVTLLPGLYVLSGAKLHVDGASTLTGTGVGLVFTGDKAKLELMHDTTIMLSAPETGAMAGILMYGQPVAKAVPKAGPAPAGPTPARDFTIQSENAQKLLGTVYLPNDHLVIGGDKDGDGECDPSVDDYGNIIPADPSADCIANVGGASAWTAIVAGQVRTNEKATLILNSNYSASTVPVPEGLGPNSNKVMLTQ